MPRAPQSKASPKVSKIRSKATPVQQATIEAETSTITKSITTTQLLLALALLGLGGLAALISPTTLIKKYYDTALITCVTGSSQNLTHTCRSTDDWKKIAETFCGKAVTKLKPEYKPGVGLTVQSNIKSLTLSNQCRPQGPVSSPVSAPVSSPVSNNTPTPPPEACPVIKNGDMVKVYNTANIFVIDQNGAVRYFPDGNVFKSWNADDAIRGFYAISQSCYSALSRPSVAPFGVNYRPGTRIVKRPSSAQLYVVEPGNTLAKISTTTAAQLYGSNLRIVEISDVFWTNYTNRGPDVTKAIPHPGMLVKPQGSATVYYINTDGTRSEVTATGSVANRFRIDSIVTVPTSSLSSIPLSSPITTEVFAISNRVQ